MTRFPLSSVGMHTGTTLITNYVIIYTNKIRDKYGAVKHHREA